MIQWVGMISKKKIYLHLSEINNVGGWKSLGTRLFFLNFADVDNTFLQTQLYHIL